MSEKVFKRTQIVWCTFGKLSCTFKDKQISSNLKGYNRCIIPDTKCGCETLDVMKTKKVQRLARAERLYDRQILRIKLVAKNSLVLSKILGQTERMSRDQKLTSEVDYSSLFVIVCDRYVILLKYSLT